jgi:hypothetical protein
MKLYACGRALSIPISPLSREIMPFEAAALTMSAKSSLSADG